MAIGQAITLVIIQGISEFLPVSSSGHLRLAEYALQLDQVPRILIVVLHVATMLAVIVHLRRPLASLLAALRSLLPGAPPIPQRRYQLCLCSYIVLASIPTALLGLTISFLELRFSFVVIGTGFLLTAILLLTQRFLAPRTAHHQLTPLAALLIGTAQGIAVIPGISRSAITISTSLLLGQRREQATQFSLLISLPATTGALLLEMRNFDRLFAFTNLPLLLVAFIATFVVGLLAVKLLAHLVKKSQLHHFAWYLFPLAVLTFLLGFRD